MTILQSHTLDLADADTLEAFYASQTNTETIFTQMSPGSAQLSARSLELDRIRVLQVDGNGITSGRTI